MDKKLMIQEKVDLLSKAESILENVDVFLTTKDENLQLLISAIKKAHLGEAMFCMECNLFESDICYDCNKITLWRSLLNELQDYKASKDEGPFHLNHNKRDILKKRQERGDKKCI